MGKAKGRGMNDILYKIGLFVLVLFIIWLAVGLFVVFI